MPAYWVVDIARVVDEELYRSAMTLSRQVIDRFGGRVLAGGVPPHPLEGGWDPERFTLVEFPSAQRLRDLLASDDFAPVLEMRARALEVRSLVAEGTEEGRAT